MLPLLLLLAAGPRLSAQAVPAPPAAPRPAAARTVTLPAGTIISAVFVAPLATRTARAGDEVYLQTSFPVTVGAVLVIPAGAFLHATLQKVRRLGLFNPRFELAVDRPSLVFPSGYALAASGPLLLTPSLDEGTVQADTGGARAAAFTGMGVAIGGAAIGAAVASHPPANIQEASSRAKDFAIAGAVGVAAGVIVGLMMISRAGAIIGVGTPARVQLRRPLAVDTSRALAPGSNRAASPSYQMPPRMCYEPGTPATPPTVIPGTPGSPGTAPTVFPGSPGTPGRYYPCPR